MKTKESTQEKKISYVREYRRHERRMTAIMIGMLFIAAAAFGGFYWVSQQPTGDDLYRVKYCRFVNEDKYLNGKESTKVWECPRTVVR